MNLFTCHLGESAYPPLLRAIARPPKRLFIDGDSGLFDRPALAIVGTRQPSPYGMRAARYFAQALAERGFVIVSGLARGIDTAAHEGALAARGETIAVLGHGLDRVYPAQNRALAARIREQGALLSEYPVGTAPLRPHFPERNRILAGLAWGTLVVEAAPQSGSLITARLALEANREVFAVPGTFDDLRFAGSHALLQQGAKLVATPEDICEELPAEIVALAARHACPREVVSEEALNALRDCFGDEPRSLADLSETRREALPQLLLAIEKARRAGLLHEVAPQKFQWASRIQNRVPISG